MCCCVDPGRNHLLPGFLKPQDWGGSCPSAGQSGFGMQPSIALRMSYISLRKKTAPARVKVRVKCSGDNFLLISRSVWPGWAVWLATTSGVSTREGRTGLLSSAQLFSMLLSCVLFCFPSLKAYRSYRSLRLLFRACLRPGICQRDQQEHSLTSPLKAGLFTRYWLGSGVSVSREWPAGASLLSQVQSGSSVSFVISAVTAAGTGPSLAVGEAEQ